MILVVVDKFSKYAHFVPMKHPYTALTVATTYMQQIFRLHGLPLALISDRDRIFTSALWQELFRLSQTQVRMSSSYHLQTDGQTERVNQCLETYLRCFVHSCPRNWYRWLFLAKYWYNTTFHSTLGRTPYEVVYGTLPREFGVEQLEQCTVPATWLKEREIMMELLQQQLKRGQDRMKAQADKKRTDREFAVGDLAFLRHQPFIQTSLAQCPFQKLAIRHYGPYKIEARVGKVAYKLKLPATSKIHPMVHVSQLKQALGCDIPAEEALRPDSDILQAEHTPLTILADRIVTTAAGEQSRLFVLWSELPPSMATWEDPEDLQRRFPTSLAWGQARTQQGENVTSVTHQGSGTTRQIPSGAETSETSG